MPHFPQVPADIDVFSPAAYLDETNLHAQLARLRREAPISWVDREPYRPFWAVTRYADIRAIEENSEVFINEPRLTLVPKAIEDLTLARFGGRRYATRHLLDMDGPEHKQYRSIAQRWFMGPNVLKLQERLDALADHFIELMKAAGGDLDFATEVAMQYPLIVVMSVLGIPDSDRSFILKITQQLLSSADPELQRSDQGGADVMQDIFAYFGNLMAEKKRNPGEDLTSAIANAAIDGAPIGAIEAISYMLLTATAGHETTAASIAGGMRAFIECPEQAAKVVANPSLMRNGASEIVRWVTPIRHFCRTASRDVTVAGVAIAAGESLMLSYPSANRDESVFSDPFDFDIERDPTTQAAFGFGPHACLGRQLALAEIRTVFTRLLPQIASAELGGVPAPIESNFTGGYKRLPVRLRFK